MSKENENEKGLPGKQPQVEAHEYRDVAKLGQHSGAAQGLFPTQLRLLLHASGYEPLPAYGKRILLHDWPNVQITEEKIKRWKYAECPNTGLRTARMPALDVDLKSADAVQAIEAFVREHFAGCVMARTGRMPKIAIPFRAEFPFAKMSVSLLGPAGDIEKLEFLADGQQVIAFGTHPDTRQAYTWRGGEPGTVTHAELPRITQQQAAQLLADAAMLIERFGYQRINQPTQAPFNAKPAPRIAPERADEETRELLWGYLCLLNADMPRERWFKLGCSCFNILGEVDGFIAWDAWSAQGTKYRQREMRSQWISVIKRRGYGYAWRRVYQEYEWAQNAGMSEQERADFEQSVANLTKRGD